MKNLSKKSFLATSSKKYFKYGLLGALAIPILAFKLPFYSKKPTYKIEEPQYEESEWQNISYTSIKKELPNIKKELKIDIPPIVIPSDDPPTIDEPIVDKTNNLDPDDFELPKEPKIFEPEPVIAKPPKIHEIVDEMPEFIGGEAALFKYIKKNVVYTNTDLEGKVYVRFVVDKNGEVQKAEVVRGVHPILNKAALKVVKNMPTWKAGKQNGENVNVYMVIPINFIAI